MFIPVFSVFRGILIYTTLSWQPNMISILYTEKPWKQQINFRNSNGTVRRHTFVDWCQKIIYLLSLSQKKWKPINPQFINWSLSVIIEQGHSKHVLLRIESDKVWMYSPTLHNIKSLCVCFVNIVKYSLIWCSDARVCQRAKTGGIFAVSRLEPMILI